MQKSEQIQLGLLVVAVMVAEGLILGFASRSMEAEQGWLPKRCWGGSFRGCCLKQDQLPSSDRPPADPSEKDQSMNPISRRQLFQHTVFGLAASGTVALTLRADAQPTPATEDAHGYEAFLDANGIPQVTPAGKWEPTHPDILGPYFLPGAPFRGKVTPPLEPGDLLVMRGRVWGFDTKKPLAHATLDVWQADAQGHYDMDDPSNPPDRSRFRNRIRLLTDETGAYEYETIRPIGYRVGPQLERPAHIHYMVQVSGYKKLITQVYFKGDPLNATDPYARQSNLIIDPQKVKNDHGTYLEATFDLVLEPD